jgi:lipopolysaccharide export system protein LptC
MASARGGSQRRRGDRVQSPEVLIGGSAASCGERLRNTLVMVVLAVLAGATWLYSRPPATTQRLAPMEGVQPLGYYIRGARILGTDEQGRISYRISADRLEELPDQQRLKLDAVRVDYTPADSDSWSISAATASGPKDRSELELMGGVTLRSEPAGGGEPTTITTESLRFYPESSSAESDTPVSIRVGGWELQSGGLRTHLKGDVVQLESNVHGKFAQ